MKKISELTVSREISEEDLFYLVRDPSGTPVSRTVARGDAMAIAPRWIDDPEYRSLMSVPSCVHNGWLYGSNQVVGQPVLMTNGVVVREGPACPVTSTFSPLLFMYSAGTYLFGALLSTRVLVTARVVSGELVTGEAVTQEVSGATGRYVRTLGDGTISIMLETGTFAAETTEGDRTITATGSGATIEPTAVPTDNRVFLVRSEDGFADFSPEWDVAGQVYFDNMVYVGAVPGLADRKVIFFFSNSTQTSAYTNEVLCCFPEEGREWTSLFTTDANTIRHFHGAKFVSGVNGVAGADILLAYTGDTVSSSNQHCSLLLCDDIADFVTNPATWKYNWGMDSSEAGFNREAFISEGPGAPYTLVYGEDSRPLTCVVDADKRYGYFIPDHPNAEGRYVTKVDLVNKDYELIGPRTRGIGGHGILTPDGTVLLTTLCETWDGAYLGTSDNYLRLYAITRGGTYVEEIKRSLRDDPDSMTTGLRWWRTMLAYPEDETYRVWLGSQTGLWLGSFGGTVCGRLDTRRSGFHLGIDRGPQPLRNYVTNGLFLTDTTGWTDSNTTTARDTDAADVDVADGQVTSLQITPSANGWDYVYYDVSDYEHLRGGWATLTLRLRNPHTDVRSWAFLKDSAGQGRAVTSRSGVTDWQELSIEMFVPTNTTRLRVMVYPRNAATGGGAIHISNVRVVPGARAYRVPARVPT